MGAEGADVVLSQQFNDLIVRTRGLGGPVIESWNAPGTAPAGLGFDGTNLLSVDLNTDTVYKHTGVDGDTTTASFASAGSQPSAVAWDGTDCLYADNATDRVYKQSGFSSTNSSSIDVSVVVGTLPNGLTWIAADSDMICGNKNSPPIRFSGFTDTVENDSLTTGLSTEEDCTWDAWRGDLLVVDASYGVRRFTGFTDVVNRDVPLVETTRGIVVLNRYVTEPTTLPGSRQRHLVARGATR